MQFQNETDINTKRLKMELKAAADWMDISIDNVQVEVKPRTGNNYRRNGTFYPGYHPRILLYNTDQKDLKNIVGTFIHELKHLDDYRNYERRGKRIPPGREKRCNIWKQDWLDDQGLQFTSRAMADEEDIEEPKKITPKILAGKFNYTPVTIRRKLRAMDDIEKPGTQWEWNSDDEDLEIIREKLGG